MDSIWVVLIPFPFAKPSPFYETDPESDVLVIVPPWQKHPSTPCDNTDIGATQPPPLPIDNLRHSGLRIKVSSKHLTLASPIFTQKLRHFHRNTSVRADGRIHLTLAPGAFHPRAVAIVLNAVHGKGSKVPKAVDIETLAQIARFVDTFRLLDVLEVYADRWTSNLLLSRGVPNVCGRELVMWVYLSSVFGHAEAFRAATRVAVVKGEGVIRGEGLPIAEGVVSAIDAGRQKLVADALAVVYGVFDGLSSGSAACHEFHCDSFLLGELTKTLSKSGLLWPRAAAPFTGVTHAAVVESVADYRSAESKRRGGEGNQNGVSAKVNGAVNGSNGIASGGGANGANRNHETFHAEKKGPASFGTHECSARRLVASLDRLDTLAEDEGLGLELESVQR